MMVMLEMETPFAPAACSPPPIDSRGGRCVFRPGTGQFPRSSTQENASLGPLARVPTASTSPPYQLGVLCPDRGCEGSRPCRVVSHRTGGGSLPRREWHMTAGGCWDRPPVWDKPRPSGHPGSAPASGRYPSSGLRKPRAANTLTIKENRRID